MTNRETSTKLRATCMVPVVGAILLLLGVFAYQAYIDRTKMINKEVNDSFFSARTLFQEQTKETVELVSTAIEVLMKDKEVQNAWIANDREALFELTSPLLEEIRLKHRITHFYFHSKDRTSFLRVYNPEKHGDRIDRGTLIRAQTTGKPTSGLEIGSLGTFTLRVVHPWYIDGQVVGYVEMGEEIKQIADKIHNLLGIDVYTFIRKKFLSRQNWEKGMKLLGREADWDRFQNVVLISHTLPFVPEAMEFFLPHNSRFTSGHTQMEIDKKVYLDNHMPLHNAAGENVGEWILLHDITYQLSGFRKAMINTSMICLLIAVALLGFFFVFLGKVERQLEKARERELREEVAHAEKMASLGVLVSGVAHEINNPTNIITFNAPLLDRACKGIQPILSQYYKDNGDYSVAGLSYEELQTELPKMVEGISQAGERIRRIVADLKDFGRKENQDNFKAVDIHSILDSSYQFMKSKIVESTDTYETNYSSSLPKVRGDYHRLEQVFKNLLDNACEALTSKSQAIHLSTQYDSQDNTILVTISDEGCGIPSDIISKIKDPFFTTKQDQGGTGLGLSVSYGIVHNHGGKLEFQSTEGKGTSVQVILSAIEDGDI